MCNNGITVNKGFVVSVTACQHIKFRNLTYVAIFVHNLLTESSTVIDNKQQKRKWESSSTSLQVYMANRTATCLLDWLFDSSSYFYSGESACGESWGIQKILRVDVSSGDIRNHLRSCHLTKLIINEGLLILATSARPFPSDQGSWRIWMVLLNTEINWEA